MIVFLLIGFMGLVFLVVGLVNVCDGDTGGIISVFVGVILLMFSTYGSFCMSITDVVKSKVMKSLASEKKINIVINKNNEFGYELQDSTMIGTFEYLQDTFKK